MKYPEIKPLSKEEVLELAESLRKNIPEGTKPATKEELKKIFAKCGSLSGAIVKERRGGDMWDDLKKWLIESRAEEGNLGHVLDKMKEIEKEYGAE